MFPKRVGTWLVAGRTWIVLAFSLAWWWLVPWLWLIVSPDFKLSHKKDVLSNWYICKTWFSKRWDLRLAVYRQYCNTDIPYYWLDIPTSWISHYIPIVSPSYPLCILRPPIISPLWLVKMPIHVGSFFNIHGYPPNPTALLLRICNDSTGASASSNGSNPNFQWRNPHIKSQFPTSFYPSLLAKWVNVSPTSTRRGLPVMSWFLNPWILYGYIPYKPIPYKS